MRQGFLIVLSVGITLVMAGVALGRQPTDKPVKLVAHRGGVVDDRRIENSLAGLQAAVDRGYWMVEADIRQSKDGQLVVHHDYNFKRFYGDERKLADLTWDEIRRIRTPSDDVRPVSFAEFTAACRGKIRLMIDAKSYTNLDSYCEAMLTSLRNNDLLESTYFIGKPEIKARFKGKARVSVQRDAFRAAIAAGEDVARFYFLFEHANHLDEEIIRLADKVDVPVVVSINTFHYPPAKHMEQAQADIARLKRIGIVSFQIDSIYDRWLLP